MFAQLINRIKSDPPPADGGARGRSTEDGAALFARVSDSVTASQREFIHLAIDWVESPLAFIDRNLQLQFANAAFCRLLGRDRESLIGRPIAEVSIGGQGEESRLQAQRALAGESLDVDFANRDNGAIGEFGRLEYRPQRTADGLVIGVLLMLHRLGRRQADQLAETFEASEVLLRPVNVGVVSAPMRAALRMAQDDILERERKQRELIESLPLPLVFVASDGLCKWANWAFCASFGLPEQQVIGSPPAAFSLPFADAVRKGVALAEDGETHGLERELALDGADLRWVRFDFLPGFDQDHVRSGVYVLLTDVHESRKVADQLREAEAHFRGVSETVPAIEAALHGAQADFEDSERRKREVVESVPLPLVFIGVDGLCRWANQAFCTAFGLTGPDIPGSEPELFSKAFADACVRGMAETAEGHAFTSEQPLAADNTGERWYRTDFVPGFDRLHRRDGLYVVLTDIDERLATHRRLQAIEAQRDELAETLPKVEAALAAAQIDAVERERRRDELTTRLPLPLLFVGRDGRCKWANQALRHLLAIDVSQIVGVTPKALSKLLPAAIRNGVAQATDGHEHHVEQQVALGANKARWYRIDFLPGFDANGAPNGAYVLLTDTEDMRHAAQKLEETESHLRSFNESIPEIQVALLAAQDDVLERKRRRHELIESLPLPLVFVGADGLLKWVNASFSAVAQLSAQDLVATSPEVHPAIFTDALRQAIAEAGDGDARGGDVSFTVDDEQRWYRADVLPAFDRNDDRNGVYVLFTDIDALRSTSQKLQESEARLQGVSADLPGMRTALQTAQDELAERERKQRELIESLPLPLLFVGADGQCKWANAAFCSAFDVTSEQIAGSAPNSLSRVFASAFRPGVVQAADGKAHSNEQELALGGFDPRWYRIDFLPAFDRDQVQSGVYVLLTDIHASRLASLRLAESEIDLRGLNEHVPRIEAALAHAQDDVAERERKQRELIESLPLPLVFVGSDGLCRWANPAYCAALQVDEEAVVGAGFEAFPGDLRDGIARALAGDLHRVELQLAFGATDARWYHVDFRPAYDRARASDGVYVLFTDIEALRTTSQRLHDSEAKLQASEVKLQASEKRVDLLSADIPDIQVALRAAQDEIAERERRRRELIERLPLPLLFIAADGQCKWANASFCAAFATTSAQIVGSAPDTLSPLFASALRPGVVQAADGKAHGHEQELAIGGSDPRWYRIDLLPAFDRDQVHSGVYVLFTDIHASRLAASRLAESETDLRGLNDHVPRIEAALAQAQDDVAERERKQRELIESLPLPLVFVGSDGLCRWANPAYCAALQVDEEAVVGAGFEAFPGDLRDGIARALAGDLHRVELQLAFGDADARWYHVDFRPAHGRARASDGVYVLFTDIEALRTTSQRLHDSEAKLQASEGKLQASEARVEQLSADIPDIEVALRMAQDEVVERERRRHELIERLPSPLVFVGADDRCKWANASFCTLSGLPSSDVVGAAPDALPAIFTEALREQIAAAVDGTTRSVELQLVDGGGSGAAPHRYRADVLPAFDRHDGRSGVYVLFTDVQDVHVAAARAEDHAARLRELSADLPGMRTALQTAQDELAERERKQRELIESLPLPLLFVGADGQCKWANAAFCSAFDVTSEQIAGSAPNSLSRVFASAFRPGVVQAADGKAHSNEQELALGGFDPRWYRIDFLPAFDRDQVQSGVYVLLTDIHASRLASLRLAESEIDLRGLNEHVPRIEAALAHAQDDVAERERKQRELIESLPLPLVFVGSDGLCRWANHAFCTAFGLDDQQVAGTEPEALSDAFASTVRQGLMQAADGHPHSLELQLVLDDAERWYRADFLPGFDRDETQNGIYVLLTDIEESRRATRRLQESEAHFRGFTENIPETIVFVDRESRFRYVNEHFVRRSGKSRDALIGATPDEAFGTEIGDRFREPIARALAGEAFTREGNGAFGGSDEAREVSYLPFRNDAGAIEGLYIVSRSLEGEKRAERAVRERDERIHFLTDNLPAQIVYLDTDLRYRYCNQRFLVDHGFERADEVIGKRLDEVTGGSLVGESREQAAAALRGERMNYERRAIGVAGDERWLSVSLVGDFAEDGTPRGLYSIAYDITDSKAAEDTRTRQQQWIEAFIENFPQPLSYLDPSGVHRFSNRAYEDFVGQKKDRIIGQTGGEVFGRDVATVFRPSFSKALDGERLHTEHEIPIEGNQPRFLSADWLPDVQAGGDVRGVYFVVQDISEAKQARLAYEESLREMQRAMDSVALPISFVDTEERLRFVNHTTTTWYGRSTEELIGLPMRDLMSADDYRFAEPYIRAALRGEAVQYEREMRYHDGARRWVLIRYVSTRDEHDFVTGFYTTATDIQSRKKQEIALQQANGLLTAHFENTPLASFTLDGDGRVTRWSSQAETLFGWRRDEVIEKSFAELGLVDADELADFLPSESDPDTATGNTRLHLVEARRRDGSTVTCEWHIAALRNPSGSITSSLALIQDVSQRVEAERRLTEIAQRDTLTRLLNRNALEPTLRAFIERARQTQTGVAVLFLDLDHFKNINDTLGHRVGDLMLIEVAAILRHCVRAEDEVARIGGDEFMVVIGHKRPKAIAHETAQRIIDALGTPIRVENQRLSVTSSIGIAVYPDHGRAPEALIRSADLAMYRAKENGKNRFEFFSALLAQRSERRSAVKSALKLALQKDSLRLYFQPRVRIADGRIVGAEALLRWTDARLGVVSPKEFIVIAEESGLIHELGLYVFRKACRQLSDWQARGVPLGVLSVNFSAHQLLVATFIDEVDRVIEETGVDPRFIEVEITETSMLFDLGVTKNVIADLKHRGMRIAIDDFGTGFSSLSHLQRLDVDTLKIDQSFIRDMLHDAGDAAITTSVISLAQGLKLSTTAEGVEKPEQLEALRQAGCDYYQGFLFSPAIVVEDIEELLTGEGIRDESSIDLEDLDHLDEPPIVRPGITAAALWDDDPND